MSVRIDQLTGTQVNVLLVLMAECRAIPNPELAQLGPKLDPGPRNKLVEAGLIEVTPGRPMVIELANDGWVACQLIIQAEAAPTKATPQVKALYTVLRSLNRFLSKTDRQPKDVFAPAEDDGLEFVATVESEKSSGAATSESGVEQEIRRAYAALVRQPRGWVGLRELRDHLSHIPRAELDGALRSLYRASDANIIPQEDQKLLTPDDRATAIKIGDEEKHLIAFHS